MNSLGIAIVGAFVIYAGGMTAQRDRNEQDGGCILAKTHRDSLSDYGFRQTIVTNVLTHTHSSWGQLDVDVSDTLDIRQVHDPELCATAMKLIRERIRDTSFAPTAIQLVHMHRYYIAQSNLSYGEFKPIYVFDDPMTRIVFPCGALKLCKP